MNHPAGKPSRYVVVDDICDAGGTFLGIAKMLNNYNPTATLELVISHGIFSKGIDELLKHYSTIYTTNSVKEQDSTLKTLNVFQ